MASVAYGPQLDFAPDCCSHRAQQSHRASGANQLVKDASLADFEELTGPSEVPPSHKNPLDDVSVTIRVGQPLGNLMVAENESDYR